MALPGIELSASVLVGTTSPVDSKYGPFDAASYAAAVTLANTEIIGGLRYKGLTVGLSENGGQIKEYWYRDGVADNNLIEKTSGGTVSTMTTTTEGVAKIQANAASGLPTPQAQSAETGRTYGVTLDGANNLVVNVPWTDDGTQINSFKVTQNNAQDDDPNITLNTGDLASPVLTNIKIDGTGSAKVTRVNDNEIAITAEPSGSVSGLVQYSKVNGGVKTFQHSDGLTYSVMSGITSFFNVGTQSDMNGVIEVSGYDPGTGTQGTPGEIRLFSPNATTGDYVGILGPRSTGASSQYTIQLPEVAPDAAGQYLKTTSGPAGINNIATTEWTALGTPQAFVTVSNSSGTGTWNYATGYNAKWTPAAGANTLAINGTVNGDSGTIVITNSQGNPAPTITWPTGSVFQGAGEGAVPVLTPDTGAVDVFSFVTDGTTYWWSYGLDFGS